MGLTDRLNKTAAKMGQTAKKLEKASKKRCPKCCYYMDHVKVDKTLSPGKAAIGGILAGTPGAIVGASMGGKKNMWLCPKCGHMENYF